MVKLFIMVNIKTMNLNKNIRKKKIIVSGASGFVAFHLITLLLKKNFFVYGLDKSNSKTLTTLNKYNNFKFYKIDLSDEKKINHIIKLFKNQKYDSFWHLAANSDISKGVNNHKIEIKDTFLTTVNSVTISKSLNIKQFIFSSSSAIFGNINKKISEYTSPARPVSNYGSMKLSSESFIYASSRYFDKILILRFPNVIGLNMTHGLIYDLINKLSMNRKEINVLGDGNQKKPYLHISYLKKYIFGLYKKKYKDKINVFNIGPSDNGIKVKDIVNKILVINKLSKTQVNYQNKKEGWVGDVIKYSYNNLLVCKTLKVTIPSTEKSVIKTIKENII